MKIIHSVDFGYLFWCPACGNCHGVWTKKPNPVTGCTWTFDGNLEQPTVTPSIRVQESLPDNTGKKTLCHVNVTHGQLIYHADCPHSYAGKTIPMEAF